jgi:rubredoxin
MKYVCDVCGFVYEEAEEMPDDYECPLCSVGKEQFSAE